MTVANHSGLHELEVESDGHLVTDKNTARLQSSVPSQAKVFAVDLRGRREPQAGIAPWILGGRGRSVDGKNHAAGDVADARVARDRLLSPLAAEDARRLEGQRGKLLYVKEIRALQMSVALGIARVDGGRLDGSLDTRVRVIGFVQGQHSSDRWELPSHVGDHHVFDLEFGHGMYRVDIPSCRFSWGLDCMGGAHGCHPSLSIRYVITIIVTTDIRRRKTTARHHRQSGWNGFQRIRRKELPEF